MKRIRVKPKVWNTAFVVDGRWLYVVVSHAGRNGLYHHATVQERDTVTRYRFRADRNPFTPYMTFRAAEKYLLDEVEKTGEVTIESEPRPLLNVAASVERRNDLESHHGGKDHACAVAT